MATGYHQMSDHELGLMKNAIVTRENSIVKLREEVKKQALTNKGVIVGVGIVSSAAFNYVRGTQEDPTTGAWNIPNTQVDVEAVTVLALAALAIFGNYHKKLKPFAPHAAAAATGIGGHYAGQVARKMGRGQKFAWPGSLVAGVPGIGSLPQYAPDGYDPTQFSSPYGDAVDQSLSSSGV